LNDKYSLFRALNIQAESLKRSINLTFDKEMVARHGMFSGAAPEAYQGINKKRFVD
jgi:hypothetical protein